MQKRKWIAMMLAGGKGTRLNLLTHNIVKPAIPFGGKYRIIDFALSNCVNSGIDAIGILTQYRPLTLHAHLGSCSHWNLYDRYGGLTILPPYQRGDSGIEWYEGTSHAVYQNLEFMEQYNPDYVLILSADQVYKMDYRLLLEHHIRTNADCTIGAVEVPWKDASRFGILKIDEEQKIVEFEEKPSRPSSNLASMGIYIFNWHVLKHFLLRDEEKVRTSRDFGKDIIPTMYEEGMRLFAYPFKGYWKDVGTVHSYWEANLDLLSRETNIFLEYPEWKIHSVERDEPPLFLDDSAKVHHSLLCDGCDIAGTVEQSVLFNGVKVGKGARIKNSVIMPKTVIEENVWIENAVVGSQSIIKSGVIIVSKNPEENLMVVGNHATIDPGVKEYLMNDSVQSVIS